VLLLCPCLGPVLLLCLGRQLQPPSFPSPLEVATLFICPLLSWRLMPPFICPPLAPLQGAAFPLPSLLPSAPPIHLFFTPPLPSQQPPLLRVPQGAAPLLPLLRSGEAGGILLPPRLQEALRRVGLLLP
jgi:hypothetical protein